MPTLEDIQKQAACELGEYARVVVATNGCLMCGDVRDQGVMKHLLENGEHEQKLLQRFISELRASDTVCVIGANIGVYESAIARYVPGCIAYSYEPHPDLIPYLSFNIAANGGIPRVIENAVSDKSGKMTLWTNPCTYHPGNTTVDSTRDGFTEPIEVYATTLDAIGRLFRHTVVKLDCEGSEEAVFRGGWSIFPDPRLRPRLIQCEIERKYCERPEYMNYLLSCGYTCEILESTLEQRSGQFITDVGQISDLEYCEVLFRIED